jgi:hypothetical protein
VSLMWSLACVHKRYRLRISDRLDLLTVGMPILWSRRFRLLNGVKFDPYSSESPSHSTIILRSLLFATDCILRLRVESQWRALIAFTF